MARKNNNNQLKTILVVVIIALFVYFIFKMVPGGGEKFKHGRNVNSPHFQNCKQRCVAYGVCICKGYTDDQCENMGLDPNAGGCYNCDSFLPVC